MPNPIEHLFKKFTEFATNPGKESFLEVYNLVVEHPGYNAYSSDLADMTEALQNNDYERALEIHYNGFPNTLLTIHSHIIASVAARELQDAQRSEQESQMAYAVLMGIKSTGEGTREEPYFVTRIEDEPHIVAHLGGELKAQALLSDNERSLDKITLKDDSTVYFDVTACLASLERKLSKDEDQTDE